MLVKFPCKMLVEKDVSSKVDGFLSSIGAGKKCAVVCTDDILPYASKFLKEIVSLKADVISPLSLDRRYLDEFSKKIQGYDFVLGVGGGRNLDAAKYAANVNCIEWVAFPTVLSHDGVISSRAVINNGGSKISIDTKEPIAIIADLTTIKNAPSRYLVAGAGDLISNFSSVKDWEIADRAGKEKFHTIMAKLALLAAEAAVSHADEIKNKDYHGIEMLLWSLLCSGFAMNIYGSSRPCSGSEHNISHALEEMGSTALHGEQVALATIITTYMQGENWERIRNILDRLDLPTTLEAIKISKDTMIMALLKAKDVRSRYSILDEYALDRSKAENLLKEVKVI